VRLSVKVAYVSRDGLVYPVLLRVYVLAQRVFMAERSVALGVSPQTKSVAVKEQNERDILPPQNDEPFSR
jgi:hypothetical protein